VRAPPSAILDGAERLQTNHLECVPPRLCALDLRRGAISSVILFEENYTEPQQCLGFSTVRLWIAGQPEAVFGTACPRIDGSALIDQALSAISS